jgi:hypothetical protein
LEIAYEGTLQREKELQKILEERNVQMEALSKDNQGIRDLVDRQKKKISLLSQSQERIKKVCEMSTKLIKVAARL